MGKNYYKILGVERNATADQIKKAYRKLAMKWHPDRNTTNKQEAESKFKEIGEAYSILSDDKKRKQYDLLGSDGMNSSSFSSGNHFTFNHAEDLFKQFFGDSNPLLDDMFSSMGGGSAFGAMGGSMGDFGPFSSRSSRAPRKGQTVQHKVYLSLEELYNGTKKTMKVSRKRLNPDGRTTKQESKVLRIEVRRGWKAGTKITFPKEGDELPGIIPADIQFIVGEKPHSVFQRDGNHLVMKREVSLKEALLGALIVKVQTLDGRNLQIPINKIVSPGYVHRVKGEGMPISKTSGRDKGDLLIQFQVRFPSTLTSQQQSMIRQYL